jgi:CTP synthase (UTP-ammonia lyase)
MYNGFQSVAADGTVKTLAAVTVPTGAVTVEIQAVTQAVSYTLDGTTPTATAGMQFLVTEPPRAFLVSDLTNLKFTQGAGGAGVLNFHFGR